MCPACLTAKMAAMGTAKVWATACYEEDTMEALRLDEQDTMTWKVIDLIVQEGNKWCR